jgi:hypothetical protein
MRKLNTKSKFLALAGLISVATLVLGPARLASAQGDAPSWSYTGNLNTARNRHTATLLQNGKVLVAGSYDEYSDYSALNSAELYDPATGTWSTTGNLNTVGGDTATLLPNGKVLVVGVVAELYDPATGTWSITGNLNTARYYDHTATLLSDGKVLVAGGANSSALNSAELYDPATGTWSITGSLNTARSSHTATLLPNGKVLVAGGNTRNVNAGLNRAEELYDPATGTWSDTGKLNIAREGHTATLLPIGKVLVAGGSNFGFLSSAELYDPATGTWSSAGNLNTAREFHTATLLPSGKVLFAGGFSVFYATILNAELYDPTTGMWSDTGSLNTGRVFHTMTQLANGKVLVAGGITADYDGLTSAELFDTPKIKTPQITGASISGKKLFVEGQNFDVGAKIILNDEKQKTANDELTPATLLIGKKAANWIGLGETVRLKVRNSDGTESAEFSYTRPAQ